MTPPEETPDEAETAEHCCEDCDHELSIINHACDFMTEADERARERLMFYLVHRYFPEGSFVPKRIPTLTPPT